ncbi:MAG: asparagine--tRNA ligase [Deltaproteobacteria bacterium RBG_13_61_14]|nr:MAG: asparagine--tRNA ligase [Deltaproteobacteria bacterium RBG_13_61_14]
MANVYVEEIARYSGQTVTLRGWLYQKRSSGKLQFLQVRDGTGTIQCVVERSLVGEEFFALADRLTQESAIMVTGTVQEDKRSPLGFELHVTDLQLVHEALDYPISPKEHGTGFLMERRHLWLRSSRQHAILRVRHQLIRAIRDFFDSAGFTLLDAPIFTPAACEGTTTLFQTDYFGQPAFLTQSGQLYLEAGAFAFGKVYCFGPTFRAEKSKTRRHLTEFWMVEPEVAYLDLAGDMDLAEDFLESIVQNVIEHRGAELKFLERDLTLLERVRKPFPRISYQEALDLLQAKGKEISWGQDFGGDEETLISENFDRPVLIHRYPAQCKAFYMKNDPADPRLALCLDVLAPEGYGEVIGGGQREDDLETLEKKIADHGLPREAFEWYLDLRKYGSVPHAGFGLGLERTVAWICGLPHVRETIPFPRLLDRLKP